jgi:preprotein translocase subunit SecG
MGLAIGILTIFLVLNALFLILLILLQLPKKEAGLGTAFGGGTTDALFGSGAGNVLTTMTKWGAVIFLVLSLTLAIMQKNEGEKRRNLGLNQITPTNAPPLVPPAPEPSKTVNPIKNIPTVPTPPEKTPPTKGKEPEKS